MNSINDYSEIVGTETINELKTIAAHLEGKIIQNINSTSVGGGVAEILSRMIPLLKELNVDARWDLIKGGEKFFEITKKIHNSLHGIDASISDEELEHFLKVTDDNLKDKILDIVEKLGIDPKKKTMTQISRFDRLKDPLGVIDVYRLVKKYINCQLVLAGGTADDDPEGSQVYREVIEKANGDKDIHILNLPPASNIEINAIQRASTVIVQKSLKEGFGLTVSESLWKGKPVVASAVGGIPLQITHKYSGLLSRTTEGTAFYVKQLLQNPEYAANLGKNGKEHVKNNFLITHHVKNYMLLFLKTGYKEDTIFL